MQPLSFKRRRFPPDVIRYAVWRYFRFAMSFRDVEELLAQRGIEVSYETIRCWTIKFGPPIAANLKRKRPAASPRWHLDEMVCKVGGMRSAPDTQAGASASSGLLAGEQSGGEIPPICRPFGRDWLALDIAKQTTESATYYFTKRTDLYGAKPHNS